MKILLAGKDGQVGWELQRTLAPLGEVVAVDRQAMNLADPDSIRKAVREIEPDLIVNAAAYTAVDKAESEPELAMAINGTAPGIMAEEAKKLNAAIIHYSTDYVFDGTRGTSAHPTPLTLLASCLTPYTEEDTPSPLNVYGQTKLAGEQAVQASGAPHLILRTSWVYGARGKNFLLTMLRLAKEREELKIVDDQIGAPTWSRMIAEATAQILAQCISPLTPHPSLFTECTGTYHLTNAGRTSWFGFAQAILESASPLTPHPSPNLIPIPTAEYPLPARRPQNSLLSNEKLHRTFGIALPNWDESLRLCLAEAGG
jgi:dTDP-4-dehydrorhamnose reductase